MSFPLLPTFQVLLFFLFLSVTGSYLYFSRHYVTCFILSSLIGFSKCFCVLKIIKINFLVSDALTVHMPCREHIGKKKTSRISKKYGCWVPREQAYRLHRQRCPRSFGGNQASNRASSLSRRGHQVLGQSPRVHSRWNRSGAESNAFYEDPRRERKDPHHLLKNMARTRHERAENA